MPAPVHTGGRLDGFSHSRTVIDAELCAGMPQVIVAVPMDSAASVAAFAAGDVWLGSVPLANAQLALRPIKRQSVGPRESVGVAED